MDDLAALGGVSVFFGTEPSSGISRFATKRSVSLRSLVWSF